MKAINLQTAHMENPRGIDLQNPVLSWTAEGGSRQTAFEISACKGEQVIWHIKKSETDRMQAVYEGPADSRSIVTWKVRLWDEKGEPGPWSEAASFEYGLLKREDWKAKWINPETEPFDPKEHQPASCLRRFFTLDQTGPARIYATAHGVYTLTVNGHRLTDHILAPGTSEYQTRLPYQTWDVTEVIRPGQNVLEVILGDGWWRGTNGNTGTRNVFGTDIALLLQMEVSGKTVLITDEHWQASQDGPLGFNDLQSGERVDARRTPHYHNVKTADFGYDSLLSANTVPLREKEAFPAKVLRTPSQKTVLDFGQNMAGYVSFCVQAKAGQRIRMTHGEYVGKDGEFSDDNLQTVGRKSGELHQVVEYICKEGINEYHPSGCIFGFQYVLLETDLDVDGSEFTAHAVYSDVRRTAWFSCDQPLVNQLFENAVWSQKSNFVDVPTDCPTRERSGWTGDAALYCHTGLRLMNSEPVYRRWLAECRAAQYPDGRVANIAPRRTAKPGFMDRMFDGSSAWGDAAVIIPYTMYRMTGDRQILEENYNFSKGWMNYCEKKAKKSRLNNLFSKNPWKKYTIDTGMQWGEWLEAGISMEESSREKLIHGAADVATAYFAQSARMMSEIAQILGYTEDEKHYRSLAEKATQAYRFIELKDGHLTTKRQCKYVRPLKMGLLSEVDAKTAAADLNRLVEENGYHLNTGFLTTAHLCTVLADYGYVHTAYRLLLQEDTPGWLYQVKQGATTIWESWEGNEGSTGVSSLNHYSKGAVVSWMIEGICGIHYDAKSALIRPQPDPLMQYAEAALITPRGRIESSWKYEGDEIRFHVVLPANVPAEFCAPDGTKHPLSAGENDLVMSQK